jgi:hypothetical protein
MTVKYCLKCEKVAVRKKYCVNCRKIVTLERLRDKWQSDASYREKHKIAARMSFRRTHFVTETRI